MRVEFIIVVRGRVGLSLSYKSKPCALLFLVYVHVSNASLSDSSNNWTNGMHSV